MYSLTFTYDFEYENDVVFFCHSFPYTTTDCYQFLDKIGQKYSNSNYYRRDLLTTSLGERPWYMLTITDNLDSYLSSNEEQKYFKNFKSENFYKDSERSISEITKSGYKSGIEKIIEQPYNINPNAFKKATKYLEKAMDSKQRFNDYNSYHRHKRAIVLSGRVHPGESNSSYWIQGTIEFLLSNTKEAKFLRTYFIFKIIPLLNPDGVAAGSYRWSLLGVDLNRKWTNPSPVCHPTIFSTKYLLKMMNKEHGVAIYTDFHGHSKKKNVFLFGCWGNPSDANANKINSVIKTYPFLVSQLNKMVCYKDWKFACEKEKESTARIVVFKELNIINSYTLEASFYKSDYKTSNKIKSEMKREQKLNRNITRRDGENDFIEEYDDHFVQWDFLNAGKDFAKAIAHSSTNSVLKNVLYPILLVSPLSDEEKLFLKQKPKKAKRKSKIILRENSMVSHIEEDSKFMKKKIKNSKMKNETSDDINPNYPMVNKNKRKNFSIEKIVKGDHRLKNGIKKTIKGNKLEVTAI